MTALSLNPQRAMVVLDELPLGCIAFRVDDNRCEPVIRRGDIVAIDTSDRMPMPDEPYLIEWSNGGRSVVAAYFTTAPAGSAWHGRLFVGDLFPRQLMNLAGQPAGEPIRWGDGPYTFEQLAEKMVGRVVGVLLDQRLAQPLDVSPRQLEWREVE